MKRNNKIIIIGLLMALVLIPDVLADNPGEKLRRGAVNIVTSPVEIPREIRAHWIKGAEMTDHISVWIFSGFIKGAVNMPIRLVSGLWDVLTFPVDLPKKYEPLIKPDYVFDEWPQRKGNP